MPAVAQLELSDQSCFKKSRYYTQNSTECQKNSMVVSAISYISIFDRSAFQLKQKSTMNSCRGCAINTMTEIYIANLPIRLGQFLKFANLVQDGLEAKLRIQQGEVVVNGIQEKRRGRQLVEGDAVEVEGRMYQIRSQEP